jgi:5-hydroxyisourate hydrolase
MTTLSSHVLDVERGAPAVGVPIELFQGEQSVACKQTDVDGRVADLASGSLAPGTYRLVFDVATYFAAQGGPAPFLQRVSIDFDVQAADPHYHVPLLVSRYACTSYRGN